MNLGVQMANVESGLDLQYIITGMLRSTYFSVNQVHM